jgi:hypothetical protein
MGHLPHGASVGIHDKNLAVSGPIGYKGDLPSVRRPSRRDVVGICGCEARDGFRCEVKDVNVEVLVATAV